MAEIERNIFAYRGNNRARALVYFTLWLLFCLVFPLNIYAQNQSVLTLDSNKSTYNIAPYSYITIDEKKELNPEILVRNHDKKLRGKKLQDNIINLDSTDHRIWILFSVNNKTNTDDWVLHFGNTLDGRMGMIKTINILNHTTKQSLSFPAPDTETNSFYLGSALSLNVKPGVENTFTMELVSEKGLPLVFAPKLISQKTYMRMLLQGDVKNIIAALLFIGIVSFFLTSFHIGRNKASIALLSYYTVLGALFFNLDAYTIPVSIINGSVLFWLYMSSFILLVIATKFFSKLSYDHRPMENIALVVLTLLMVTAVVLDIFVFANSATGLVVVSGTIGLCLLLLATITFFTSEKPAVITIFFGSALLLSGAALALITTITLGLVEPSYVTYFWYIHIFQAACFMTAYLQSNVYRKNRKKNETEHKVRDEHSLARLQKSKDSADQARLLRVIERERELMSELREREIKRTEEMRHSKEIADRANQAKSAFLAVVSHEIRTPMNGIMGMVQLLQTTSLSKTQSDYVDTIRRSGDTMMALLNDILDFEKIERGSMEVETVNFNLQKLVQDIIILMSGHASQKNIALNSSIESDVPEIVSGDPTRLRQVLLNLVNNGLKFTEEGEVLISVKMVGSEEDKKVRFEVKDTGIGISKSAQTKLFTPFTQAETSISRKYGGTGLGLAISYRLIEAMGGVIEVESIENEGSTFFFDLTMGAENANMSAESSFFDPDNIEEQKIQPMRILVTEDNEMNRKVLEGLLTQQGHTLFMAANGLEALDICRKHHPDLVLMDIQMDGLSGLETTKKLRADPEKDISTIPVIALTGNVMLEDIETFFAAGMNGFIAKPIDSNQLNELLYNASIGKFENDIQDKEDEGTIAPVEPTTASSEPQAQQEAEPADTPDDASKNDLDLKSIPTDLSFDDREHFVADADVKSPSSSPITQMRDDNIKPEAEKKRIAPIVSTPQPAETKIVSPPKPEPEEEKVASIHQPMEIKRQEDKPLTESTKIKTVVSKSKPAENETKDKPSFNRNAPDDEMTEIQRYLMQQHSSNAGDQSKAEIETQAETPSSTSEAEAGDDENPPTSETVELLDNKMLESLLETLGKEQFTNLLNGFLAKATDIIADLEINVEENNISALGARAHELKGMAGNFGMKHVSKLAGDIEKAAKLSKNDDAIKTAQKLSAANDQTRAALLKWADQ